MGKYDIAVCKFLSDNERFAELVNASEFGGRPVLRGDMLRPDDSRYVASRSGGQLEDGQVHFKQRFRDIKKRTKSGDWIVITAIENQENIDYNMPLRMMEYDLLEYNVQIHEIEKNKAKAVQESGKVPCNWNTRLTKQDKIHPVHSICFYHGIEPWDGPRSLKDMMDFEGAPSGWEELFHDYGMSLFCAGEIEDLSVFQTGLRQFLEVIPLRKNRKKLIELWNREEYRHLDRDTAEVIAVLTDCTTVLERLDDYEKEGEYDMCQAMDEWKEELLEEGKLQGIEQGIGQESLRAIQSIMSTLKLNIDQAMEALMIPESDRDNYRAIIR